MKKKMLGIILCSVVVFNAGCGNKKQNDISATNNLEKEYPVIVNGKGYDLDSVISFSVTLKGSNNDYNTSSFGLVTNIMKKNSSMEDIVDSFRLLEEEYNYVDVLKGGPVDQDIYEDDYFNYQLKYEIANADCYSDPENCEKVDFTKDLKILTKRIKITKPGDYKISLGTYSDYSNPVKEIASTIIIK